MATAFFPPWWGASKVMKGKQQRKENLRGIPISCLHAEKHACVLMGQEFLQLFQMVSVSKRGIDGGSVWKKWQKTL